MILLAAAHAAEILRVDPTGPLEVATVDLGGFVQPRFTYTEEERYPAIPGELGFAVDHARIEVGAAARAERWFQLRSLLSVELMPEARLKDAWVDVGPGPWLRVRAGQMKPPLSRTALVSDRDLLLGDRPEIADFTNDREIGAMLISELGTDHVEIEAGAFNGEGANRVANVDDKLVYVARVVLSPDGGPGTVSELLEPDQPLTWSFGGSAFANMMGDTGTRESISGLGIEAFAHAGPLTAQAEARWTWIDWEDTSVVDSTANGFYVQAGCFLTPLPVVGDHVALLARVEQLDPYVATLGDVPLTGPSDPAQERQTASIGIGVYADRPLFRAVRDLKAVAWWSVRQELEGARYDNDGLILATQFGF